MSRFDFSSLDPAVLAELEVIDRTLAGQPVEPGDAELAELTLLLVSDREQPEAEFVRTLDARVAHRFTPAPASGPAPGRRSRGRRLSSSWPLQVAMAGVAAVVIAVVVVVSVGTLGGSNTARKSAGSVAGPSTAAKSAGSGNHNSAAKSSAASSSAGATSGASKASKAASGGGVLSVRGESFPDQQFGASGAASTTSGATTVPAPVTTGRKVTQSAQLTLRAANDRIDTVAQEVYNVVAAENGIVKSSKITDATPSQGSGSAVFSLSIPSANLETTLEQMSKLHFASVLTRSNSTTDVTNTYNADRNALQDQQALRLSLLKRLGEATTTAEIDSLKSQIELAESQIRSDESTLANLEHKISYSSLSVQIDSGSAPAPVTSSSHGFTLGGAWHDAIRVLVVAAGVIVVAAAVLIPVALVAALLGWLAHGMRKLRRERELERS